MYSDYELFICFSFVVAALLLCNSTDLIAFHPIPLLFSHLALFFCAGFRFRLYLSTFYCPSLARFCIILLTHFWHAQCNFHNFRLLRSPFPASVYYGRFALPRCGFCGFDHTRIPRTPDFDCPVCVCST